MKLILKYFKPFIVMAIFSLALLFAQNIADLWLPTYMSKIVDTGIINGGIEEASPRALSADAMELLTSFMSEESAAVFRTAYAPAGSADAALSSDFAEIGASDYVFTETDAFKAMQVGGIYSLASVEISTRLSSLGVTDVAKMDPAELYAADLSISLPESFNPAEVPPQTQFEIGATLTKLLYKDLGANLTNIQQMSILSTGGIMILITVFGMVVTIVNGFLSARISTGIGRNIRRDVFSKVQTFAPSEFDRFSTATLITRCTNDVQQVQQVAMMSLRMIFSAPIMGIGGVVMALRTSRDLSWIIVVAVIFLLLLQTFMFTKVFPKFQIMQRLLDKLNLVTRESLTGMLVIRAFGNEAREMSRFESANKDIKNTNIFVQRMMATVQPFIQLLMGCTTLTVIFFGTQAISNSNLQVGQMMAFMQYVMQIMQSFMMIGMMFIMIPRALVSATRVSEVLNCKTSINDKPENEIMTLGGKAKGELAFNNVSFAYADAEQCVLENITFTARAGETTAFIGSTGSGKSTLINLIPRFYDVSSGSITLDGIDIRDISMLELRENLGYVPQKGVLFSGDIASNLSFGKEDGTDEEFAEAIRIAQAENFVFADKEGLATEIAQGGDNVSGGQKQRLSIARALVRKPAVYIFDDSFSALDFKTDVALRRALYEHTDNATVLIVAQRVSTIMTANQIIVLDEGKIVGSGTHAELLKSCEAYREIAESQLSKEELE